MHSSRPSSPAANTSNAAPLSFTVGLAGRFSGDDGTGGHLAASLHYACRMAAQLDTTLGHGPLAEVRVWGGRALAARISWGVGGECLMQATTRPDSTAALAMAASETGTRAAAHPSEAVWTRAHEQALSSAHVDAAIRAVHDRTGATWTSLLDAALRPERLFGDLSGSELAVVANRCQGVLRGLGLGDAHVLVLTYASASLVVLPLEPSARNETLALLLPIVDADALTALVTVTRKALMTPPPAAPAAVEDDELEGEPEELLGFFAPADFVPTGARFAGMLDDREPWRPRMRRTRTN